MARESTPRPPPPRDMDPNGIWLILCYNLLKMGWNWWQRICEHNLHLRIPSPHPKTLIYDNFCLYVCVFHVFWNPKQCFSSSTLKMFNWSRLYRRGSSKIKMSLDLWTESSKIEVQHFLTTKSSLSGLWVFDWFWPPCHGNLSLDPPPSWQKSPEWV